jgi:2,4-dienoyl-CoA reductase-like NADH-dependent reductase (Old Yellow Enzyme family)/thioredoxin reductase
MQYETLFSQGKIGNVTIKNRVVQEPMMLGHGCFDGTPTEQMMNYYEERARGKVGLIITEITRINDSHGVGSFSQLGISHDYQIEPLAEMIRRIHSHGTKLFVQLQHPGRQNAPVTVGTLPISIASERLWPGYKAFFYKMAPQARALGEKGLLKSVVAPSKTEPCRYSKAKNRALRHSEIKKLIQQFIDGAVRAQKAGADGVELHAAHGYLIEQFLSPYTNKRTDEYGGTLENRMRFLLEIIAGIREKCGQDFPIVVRLTVDECYAQIGEEGRGYALSDGVEMAKRLELAGIDAIDVSSATYETMNYWLEPTSFDLGWRKYMAEAVKKAVNIPVIAANLIRTPEQAEEQLNAGVQDFIGLGRPLLADPHWAKKALEGHPEDIKRCMCCLWCFESMQENAYKGTAGECAVNPFMGREIEKSNLKIDGAGRNVVIVGAGPAGLTAAEVLGMRGYKPIVLEKASSVGGQLLLANKPPKKEKISWCFEDLEAAAVKSGAEIRLNVDATPQIISAIAPYAVIIATGGQSVKPRSIPGVDLPKVCTITEMLNGEISPKGEQVAVIGSGMSGLETALALAELGNNVTVVEMAHELAPGAYVQHTSDILPKLEQHGTRFLTGKKLVGISETDIVLEDVFDGKQETIQADCVVLSLGVRPVNDLYQTLKGQYQKLYLIGDADKIGRVADATRSAYKLAMSL